MTLSALIEVMLVAWGYRVKYGGMGVTRALGCAALPSMSLVSTRDWSMLLV
jgi:hypothetical protein